MSTVASDSGAAGAVRPWRERGAASARELATSLAVGACLAGEWVSRGVVYNPLSARFQQDPYEKYRYLREHDPIHRSLLFNGWVVSRHEHVDAILRDDRHFSKRASSIARGRRKRSGSRDETPSMLFMDPPDHTRLRRLLNRAFTQKSIEKWRTRVEEIVQVSLDAVPVGEPFDFMEVVAARLPVTVIADIIGIPEEEREGLRRWSGPVARSLEPTISQARKAEVDRAFRELTRYFTRAIAAQREKSGTTLLKELMQAEEDGEHLSQEELLATLRLLLVAGNETTTNLIGNGLYALLRNPDQIARLRREPELTGSAVEELLRFDSPIQTDGRIARDDIDVGGVTIRRGQIALLLLGSANRDPEVFEYPDRLDITRDDTRHVAFARGIHYCLGAILARLEAQAMLRGLLDRFSTIDLVEQPQYESQIVLRGLRQLRLQVFP